MKPIYPIARDLVLVGGGHSHVILLRMLGMNPVPGLQVTLISPDVETPYSGMLPGVVAGHYTPSDIHIDLVPLCRFAGARFIRARVEDIDPYGQLVHIPGRPSLGYDVLSLNVGITPSLDIPGAEGRVIPVKPISSFLGRWQDFKTSLKTPQARQVAIVGAGAGGVELCLAIHQYLHSIGDQRVRVHLVFPGEELLSDFPEKVGVTFMNLLAERGIELHAGFEVTEVLQTGLMNASGTFLATDDIFWVTQAASQDWLLKAGLALDTSGFVKVRDTLQTHSFDNIFAAGDISHTTQHPRPKAGVFAVRQGPVLYRNIRRLLLGKTPKPYRPQRAFLSLISTGDQYAVASRGTVVASGRWVWRLKNWIDRRFMRQFQKLPTMDSASHTGLLADFDDQMHCGGCGSKVAGDILGEVLRSVGLQPRQMDDAAVVQAPTGKLLLYSLDAFKSFIDDPFIYGQVAVHHALSDIYAMGGVPTSVLTTITVPYAKPAKTRSLLEQALAGVKKVLDEEGVTLIGGHTTEGLEWFLGLAVNGTVDEDALMSKGKLKPGDHLVLTKPLGTGVLFAADIQHLAQGYDIQAALRIMLQSNRQASEIFAGAGVRACTDVTGFGLAGHLLEMLKGSKMTAVLNLDRLPVLSGAMSLMQNRGIRSSLHEGNMNASRQVQQTHHARKPILFDPQTSGGLLAGVPEAELEAVISRLRGAGYQQAASIGRVIDTGRVSIAFE